MAVWNGKKLIFTSHAMVAGARNVVADTLGIPRDDVHIVSSFVGGGSAAKGSFGRIPYVLPCRPEAWTPVKVVLSRQEMFTSVGHRGSTRQTIALGADSSGKLTAIQHENLTDASMVDDFIERCGIITGFPYTTVPTFG